MVLVGICLFVLEELDETIISSGEETTKAWTNLLISVRHLTRKRVVMLYYPVDPVSLIETSDCLRYSIHLALHVRDGIEQIKRQ